MSTNGGDREPPLGEDEGPRTVPRDWTRANFSDPDTAKAAFLEGRAFAFETMGDLHRLRADVQDLSGNVLGLRKEVKRSNAFSVTVRDTLLRHEKRTDLILAKLETRVETVQRRQEELEEDQEATLRAEVALARASQHEVVKEERQQARKWKRWEIATAIAGVVVAALLGLAGLLLRKG